LGKGRLPFFFPLACYIFTNHHRFSTITASSHHHEKLLEQALRILFHIEQSFSPFIDQRYSSKWLVTEIPPMVEVEAVQMGTITVAILKAAATTPVAIPTGMTT